MKCLSHTLTLLFNVSSVKPICSTRHLATVCQLSNYKMTKRKAHKGRSESLNTETEMDSNRGKVNRLNKNKQTQSKKPASPFKINLVVIGTGGPGASRSLLLTTEVSRYMFNCGEGTQRLAAMNKSLRTAAFAKLAGVEQIFITHKSWKNIGGLLGLAMTLEGQKNPDSKVYFRQETTSLQPLSENPHITVYGPPGVENLALMAKRFTVNSNLNIVRHEGEFSDNSMIITPLPIYKQTSGLTQGSLNSDDDCDVPRKRQKKDSTDDISPQAEDVIYAYLCRAHPPLPKINVEKCLNAGITMGPMVGQLQQGKSVVLTDGRVVHPEEVTDVIPTDQRPILIIECPSPDFLAAVQASPELRPHMNSLAIVVHMTPAEVYHTAAYKSWMKEFDTSTNHMVLNEEAGEMNLVRAREHQALLNIVSQSAFPMLPPVSLNSMIGTNSNTGLESHDSTHIESAIGPSHRQGNDKPSWLQREGQVVFASSGLHYTYRGKQGLGFHIERDEFDCQKLQAECTDVPEVQSQLAILRQTVLSNVSNGHDSYDDSESVRSYPKVTFMGTGSSEPNLIRGQSCIVVQVSKHSTILLDCGEDSFGQLYRFFGSDKISRVLTKIEAIFVSHMHADHHLGLFSILKERKLAFERKNKPFTPAIVIAPIQLTRWLKFYDLELEPVSHLFRFAPTQPNFYRDVFWKQMNIATFEDVKTALRFNELQLVEVEHCRNAFGISFTMANGCKLVYSGDTRPCDRLVAAGENCDLLIHEATHEDALKEHAKVSKHSTFSEAIDVGKRMQAKHIILTHFSQRYPYVPPVGDLSMPDNVSIAFDNMHVNPQILKQLPHYIPLLLALFSDKLVKHEIKSMRRLREKENKENKLAVVN